MPEVLPGKLLWVPALGIPMVPRGAHVLRLGEHQYDANLRGGRYQVAHYSQEALGRAVGPLALDQTLAFCRLVDVSIAKHGLVAVTVNASNAAERANVAVLLGAYLILRKKWTVEQVAGPLGTESRTAFPCSWAKPSKGHEQDIPPMLTVQDCWEGVALAARLGWVNRGVLDDDFSANFISSQYRRMIQEYDAVWLAHGKVLVAADPMTVICDPNPRTCSELVPSEMPARPDTPSNLVRQLTPVEACDGWEVVSLSTHTASAHHPNEMPSTPTAAAQVEAADRFERDSNTTQSDLFHQQEVGSVPSDCPTQPHLGGGKGHNSGKGKAPKAAAVQGATAGAATASAAPATSKKEPIRGAAAAASLASPSSCHTVCKDYADREGDGAEAPEHPPQDFATWAGSHGVELVVRANFAKEAGLKEIGGTYNKALLEAHGLRHLDLPVVDQDGGVPDARSLQILLRRTEFLETGGAMLVHCKGGFGRSVVMACCCLIHQYDVPGRALLGWVRIARPGAITTAEQERFLCRFRGRDDLDRHLQLSSAACCTIS